VTQQTMKTNDADISGESQRELAAGVLKQAAQDLRAKKLMPVHWGKFGLANHNWDDPILQVSKIASENNMPLITPQIGEEAKFDSDQHFKAWWKNLV